MSFTCLKLKLNECYCWFDKSYIGREVSWCCGCPLYVVHSGLVLYIGITSYIPMNYELKKGRQPAASEYVFIDTFVGMYLIEWEVSSK